MGIDEFLKGIAAGQTPTPSAPGPVPPPPSDSAPSLPPSLRSRSALSPAAQPSAATQTGITEVIGKRIAEATKAVGRNQMDLPALRRLWRFLRSQLTNVYGRSSDIANLLPPAPTPVARDDAARLATALIAQAQTLVDGLNEAARTAFAPARILIGHGHSLLWLKLERFLKGELGLECDEFNAEEPAGIHTTERLTQMLSQATFAFLVMTAEIKHADGTLHARENVVHEVGLCQARLGTNRAVVLLEDGCEKCSNMDGLTHIPFPKGEIDAAFERVRRVLTREGVLQQQASTG